MKRLSLSLVVLLVQFSGNAQHYDLVLQNVIVIGETNSISGQDIFIKADTILKISPHNSGFVAGDSIRILDLKGKYILPGLIDAHVHFATDPSDYDRYDVVVAKLELLLKSGITSVRDMAGDTRALAYLSRQAMLDEIKSPDIYYASLMAGPQFFDDPRTISSARGLIPGEVSWMRSVTDETDIFEAVAEAKGTGAKGIKIYAEVPPHLVGPIVREAHKINMLVWAHAAVIPSLPSDLIMAGVDVLSHSNLLLWEDQDKIPESAKNRYDQELLIEISDPIRHVLEEMKKNGTYLDATIATFRNERFKTEVYQNAAFLTRSAFESGIQILVGTDIDFDIATYNTPIIDEMEALVNDAGMSTRDVIQSATIINARMLGVDSQVGTIEAGKRANLLIVEGDPIKDIRNLKNVLLVIKNGIIYEF